MASEWKLRVATYVEKFEKTTDKYRLKDNILIRQLRVVRGLFLFVNRIKIKYFSFYDIEFWSRMIRKRNALIYTISCLPQETKSDSVNAYSKLVVTTLKRHNGTYGMMISLVLRRVFGEDITSRVCEYI